MGRFWQKIRDLGCAEIRKIFDQSDVYEARRARYNFRRSVGLPIPLRPVEILSQEMIKEYSHKERTENSRYSKNFSKRL